MTVGGVPLKEIDFQTMESKLVPGLYLVGEILDYDGQIGGFNFQWAWATGLLAVGRFPQVCVQTARLADEYPVSLNAASARNLRFLDREKEIIYPWIREGLICRQVRAWELARC